MEKRILVFRIRNPFNSKKLEMAKGKMSKNSISSYYGKKAIFAQPPQPTK